MIGFGDARGEDVLGVLARQEAVGTGRLVCGDRLGSR